MQNVWGEENVLDNAPSRKFLDPSMEASGLLTCEFVQEKQSTDSSRVQDVPDEGGSKTVLGRGPS